MMEWPPLVSRVRQAALEGLDPQSEEAQALANAWLELFQSMPEPIRKPNRSFACRCSRSRIS
jgi:hypothetical protein